MLLPQQVIDFIKEASVREGAEYPGDQVELFNTGILDSFGLVDFVSVVEESCGITIPDEDIKRSNFNTLETIENYINSRMGA